MRLNRLIVLSCFFGAFATANAGTLASDDFGTGADGWTAINGASTVQWAAGGGDPGGFVFAQDAAPQQVWLFVSGPTFTGDFSTAYGGTLSFALRSTSKGTPLVTPYSDVKIFGANGLVLASSVIAAPATGWSTFSTSLVAGDWYLNNYGTTLATVDQIKATLGDVTSVHIRGDYTNAADFTALDSVVLSAVPEPGTWLMSLAGMAFLAAEVRRRRSCKGGR